MAYLAGHQYLVSTIVRGPCEHRNVTYHPARNLQEATAYAYNVWLMLGNQLGRGPESMPNYTPLEAPGPVEYPRVYTVLGPKRWVDLEVEVFQLNDVGDWVKVDN